MTTRFNFLENKLDSFNERLNNAHTRTDLLGDRMAADDSIIIGESLVSWHWIEWEERKT